MTFLPTLSYSDKLDCPICGAIRSHLLFHGDRYEMGLKNVICGTCSHIFVRPRPTQTWLDEFYVSTYRQLYNAAAVPDEHYLAEHAPEKLNLSRNIEAMVTTFGLEWNATFSLLDIGCAEGFFLQACHARFPNAQIYGVEPSSEFADCARTLVPDATIFTGIFDDFHVPTQSLRVICASHVLEHILEPVRFLRRVHSLLEPGGFTFMEFPVGDRQQAGNYFHIAHINHFTRVSLEVAFRLAGFELVSVDTFGTRGVKRDGAYRVFARKPSMGTTEQPSIAETLLHASPIVQRMRRQFARFRKKQAVLRLARRLRRLAVPQVTAAHG